LIEAAAHLRTGAACGLHFQGELEKENYAVAPKSLVNYFGRIRLRSRVPVPRAVHDAAPDAVEERKPEDYDDREGYDPRFLGNGTRVNLPKKKVRPRDVLTFGTGSRRTSELKYTHFSVAMSRKRKLCLWSAVNIDGAQSKKRRRTGWKIDPRIKRSDQLVGDEGDDDVYGNPPRFARGHMTRREDPIWGTPTEADLGNEDSMHLTNSR
jgi:endonuclease G